MSKQKSAFVVQTNTKQNSLVNAPIKPNAEMQILIGGPYYKDGEEHRYGHAALRIKTESYDLTYDFGRYGRETGVFGESGEGILRVWTTFAQYIKGENFLKRKTTGFVYLIFSHQADKAKRYFDVQIRNAAKFGGSNTHRTAFKLAMDYHALGPNCTTITLDGAREAVRRIDSGSERFIKPSDVLNGKELLALRLSGGPTRMFLPANLKDFLDGGYPIKFDRKDEYGGAG